MMTPEEFEAAVGKPLEKYHHDCHAASLALVKSGTLPAEARVARGTTPGVGGQHSWVTLGSPYDPTVEVIDPTLWSYVDTVTGVWTGRAGDRPHLPHGWGLIWHAGCPTSGGEGEIRLAGEDGLSVGAQTFLEMVRERGGPTDRRSWSQLANGPMQGWPAREIITAMYADDRVKALIPIDIVGMVTDLNPSGLYLAGEVDR